MEISIIYEDEQVLVINKPAGLVVHQDGKTKEPTLVDWILEHRPQMKGVGEPLQLSSGALIDRPGIVHRIDRETSGVLIVAKTQESFLHVKQQFQGRDVQKEYRAFVYGEMKQDEGIIDRPIGRSSSDFRLWSAQRGARGTLREAITEYKVLNRLPAQAGQASSGGFSYLAVFPKTGRTHQIRAHFKAINYPIVCDALYAPKRECALGFSRLALHAFAIELTLPSGEKRRFEAELPADFISALRSLA